MHQDIPLRPAVASQVGPNEVPGLRPAHPGAALKSPSPPDLRRARSRFHLICTALIATSLIQTLPGAAAEPGAVRDQWIVVRTYSTADSALLETIRVPVSLFARLSSIMPGPIRREMEAEGLPVDELVRLVVEEDLRGPVAEFSDEADGERTIVSIE